MEYTFSNDQDTGDIPSQPANNDVKRGNVIRDHQYTSGSSTFQNYLVKVLRFFSALIFSPFERHLILTDISIVYLMYATPAG